MQPLYGMARLADAMHQSVCPMLRAGEDEDIAVVLREERQEQRPLLVRLNKVHVLNRLAGRHRLWADSNAGRVLRLLVCQRPNFLCESC